MTHVLPASLQRMHLASLASLVDCRDAASDVADVCIQLMSGQCLAVASNSAAIGLQQNNLHEQHQNGYLVLRHMRIDKWSECHALTKPTMA